MSHDRLPRHADDATLQADAERRRDKRRERLLMVKALVAIALVSMAITLRGLYF